MNGTNLADILTGVRRRFGRQTALASDFQMLSFDQMMARAAQSARELASAGVSPGDRVGIATRENTETMTLVLAVWMLDATAVPIDFRIKPAERIGIAHDFGLAAIAEDRPAHPDAGYIHVLVNSGWTDRIGGHDPAPLYGPRQHPALIQLSSGTTAKPIGLVVDHANLLARLMLPVELAPRNTGGAAVTAIQLSFALSLHYTLNQLLNGTAVHFVSPLSSGAEFGEAIRARAAHSACVVPTILHGMLAAFGDGDAPAFPDVTALYCGGAPLMPEDKRRARRCLSPGFLESYASNVTGRVSLLIGEDVERRPETVGRVLPQVTLEIVDPQGHALPPGEVGEIRVRSPGMAREIYGGADRPQGDRFRDGWAYPGDLGSIDAEGFLKLHGRGADLIIRRGVNVHPAEVEEVIAQVAGVREVAVTGFLSPREGEDIAAFVVVDPGTDTAVIDGQCRLRLPPEKRPGRIILTDSLPRNANGKVMRKDLRAKVESGDT